MKIPFINRLQNRKASTSNTKAESGKAVSRNFYYISYFTGRFAIKAYRAVRHALSQVFSIALSEAFGRIKVFVRNISEFKRSRAGRGEISFTRGVIDAALSFRAVFKKCAAAFRHGGLISGCAVTGRFIQRGVADFFAQKRKIINYLAPAGALAALAFTVYFWSGTNFALQVNYGNKQIGLVKSENVYLDAAQRVEDTVSDSSGTSFKLDKPVSYKIVLANKADITDEDSLYTSIIQSSGSGVQNGYGLYVDSHLAGVNNDSGQIEAMLTSIKDSYKTDSSVQSVSFVQNVSIKNGIFPEGSFKDTYAMKNELTGKTKISPENVNAIAAKSSSMYRISLDPVYEMNMSDTDSDLGTDTNGQPVLSVKVVKNEVRTESIPFTIKQEQSKTLYKGKTKISVPGKKGTKQIFAEVTYIDGVKVGENVVSTTVTAQPVVQKVLVGIKSKSSGYYYNDGGVSANWYNAGTSGGVVGYAYNNLGIPYVYGGTTRSGFDCSGFTSYVYRQYGVYLPHSAAGQSAYGSYVSRSQLQPGDLVFFDTNGGHNSISHVGIYVGGGNFVDASSSRPHCTTVDSINSAYYSSRYMTARRVK